MFRLGNENCANYNYDLLVKLLAAISIQSLFTNCTQNVYMSPGVASIGRVVSNELPVKTVLGVHIMLERLYP